MKENFKDVPNLCSGLDCLIEGSRRDCASHFIFRLACFKSRQIQDYWVNAEKEVFLYRLKCGGEESVYNTTGKLLNDIKKMLLTQHLSKRYATLLKQISLLIEPVLHNLEFIFCTNRRNCDHYLNVPWILVQELVSKREVYIEGGSARIPCSHLLSFLASLFKELLLNGIEQLKILNFQIEDIRIMHLIKSIHSYFLKLVDSRVHYLHEESLMKTYSDVDKEVKSFPLCMQQLHFQLKKSHRLNHYERFRYSLFLKDAGLPLAENIRFWKHYYSLPPKCSHLGCQHSWIGTAAKRFEYGIRHMYGDEGKRVSYSSHSCSALQALNPQPQESGGCSFKHLEQSNLSGLVSANELLWPTQRESILKAAKDGNPSLACGLYLSAVLHRHIPKPSKLSRFASYSSWPGEPKRKAHYPLKKANSLGGSPVTFFASRFTATEAKSSRKRVECVESSSSSKSRLTTLNQQDVKQSCLECNYDVVRPVRSYLSPKDYYKIVKSNDIFYTKS